MRNRLISMALLTIMLVGCSAGGMSTAMPTLPTVIPNALDKQPTGAPPAGIQVLLIQSVVTVGANRFAVGLLSGDSFIKGAKLTFTFYDLTGKSGDVQKPVAILPATYREAPEGLAGIYTTDATFANAGSWGLAIAGTTSDGYPINQQVGFDVVATSPELAVGKQAPAAKSPTLESVNNDLKRLSSAPNPIPDFYRLSLDQAVGGGKPVVVQFSTPAFCSSRLCGPVYDVMSLIFPVSTGQANFVDVEVYKDLPTPNLKAPQYADAMLAWGLKTEPWTYVLDKNGIVTWRAEGLITTDELKDQI